MSRKGFIYGFLMLVCVTFFALLSPDNDVKAWDADLWLTIDGNYSDGTIPANGDWNSIQAGKAQNGQHAIPSSVITNGTAVGFGVKNQGQYGSTWGYMTFYIKSPTSYTAQRITYNGSPYDIKYPCGFINYYPTDVEIPVGYTTCSETNSTRSVVYPNTSNGSLGTIDAAFICPTGNELLAISNYRVNQVVNPLETNDFSYQNFYFTDGYSNGILVMHPSDNNNNWGINNYWGMADSPVPIFCDFYDALEYSCSGRILYPEHVLFGADSAVVTPTPSPTATPSPTPMPTQIPFPTSISIDNWPTPVPTATPTPSPTPWFPYYDSLNPSNTPVPGSDDEYVDSINKQAIGVIGIPSVTPSETDFWDVDNTYLWKKTDGFFPDNTLTDFLNPDKEESETMPGSVFRYPRTAMENTQDSGYLTFLSESIHCFDRGSGGDDSIAGPGDNVITYILFFVVGMFVLWFFNHIIR